MKYAITPDMKIHQVVDEKEFYKWNPNAQDITHLKGVYENFCKQEQQFKKTENIYCKKCKCQYGVSIPRKIGEPNFCSTCGNKLITTEEYEELKIQWKEVTKDEGFPACDTPNCHIKCNQHFTNGKKTLCAECYDDMVERECEKGSPYDREIRGRND